ncbi:MAG: glycosyltransferase family 2 protein [Vicinamibacterales bacterium]
MNDASPVDVSIAIVNWNTSALTRACLDALPAATGTLRADTWVVDNASSDDSVEMIRRCHPTVHVLTNTKNVGYGSGMNQAIAASHGRYVLVLNSDTVPHPGSIERMVRHMDDHSGTGAVGPMLLNPDGSFQAGFSDFPTLLSETLCVTGIGARVWFKNYPNYSPERSRAERRVDCIAGACMLIRRRVIDDIGAFDESFFMYSEEVDWCFRICRAGWDIVYLPDAVIVHYGGQSTRQVREPMYRALYRHKVRFFRKHYGRAASLTLATVFVAATRLRRVVCQLSGAEPNPALAWSELMNQRFS